MDTARPTPASKAALAITLMAVAADALSKAVVNRMLIKVRRAGFTTRFLKNREPMRFYDEPARRLNAKNNLGFQTA